MWSDLSIWSDVLTGLGPPTPQQPTPQQPLPPQPYAVAPRGAQMAGLFGQQPTRMPMMRAPGSLRQGMGAGVPARPRMQMPGSAGLFDLSMQEGMMPRYRPPAIEGIYGDTGRGYSGFLGPKMPKLTPPQAAALAPLVAGLLSGQEANPSGVGGVGPGDGTPGGESGGSGGNSASGPGGGASGIGGATGAGVGGDGYARGGLVTTDRLIGPNPPGPDDGYAALDAGEVVIPRDMVAGLLAQAQGPEVLNAKKNKIPQPARFDELDKAAGAFAPAASSPPPGDQLKFTGGGTQRPKTKAQLDREAAVIRAHRR